MKAFTTYIAIVLLLLVSIPVQAETLQSFNLEQAIDLAVTNNPQMKAAQARLGVSQAEITTAGARLNPALLSDNGIAEDTYRLGIEKTFELGGKRRKRVALAQAQREGVLSEINTLLLDLRANVRRAYTQLYNAQERQSATNDIVQTTERLLDIARKREHAGDISQLDVLQADIAVVNSKNDLQTVAYQVVEAKNRLNILLNQPIGTDVILAPPTGFQQPTSLSSTDGTLSLQAGVTQAEANLDSLLETAFNRRPELQQSLRNITVTERQLELAQANRVPNLTLAAGPDIVTGEGGAVNAFIIGNIELPIFNRQQGPIQEAMARRLQLEQEQAALKNRIALEVTNAFTAFRSAQDRVLRYETEILPKVDMVVDKSRRAFEEGKAPILTPINAQQAYINTRLGYLQALLDYQNAISDLERAVGTGL